VHKIDRYTFDDKSVIAMVIETGFGTQQGKLIRKMMTNTPPDNTEAYMFLLFLLIFAVLSSIIVLYQSIKMGKSNYKIMLEIILILTNVVPPELPLELTIAVNAAVHKLLSQGVFCLEPFRIVRAGVLDVACFDKTGTLTESEMVVHSIVAHDEHGVAGILSTCHSLLEDEQRRVVGDPLEMSAFTYVNAQMVDECTIRTAGMQYDIKKRFYFSSALRRMCVVYREGKKRVYRVGMKGAPETVRKFLARVPEQYDEYRRYAAEGYRVLALAGKHLLSFTESTTRESVEKDLVFVGFVLYKSKVKEESRAVVDALKGAGCAVVMITGDNALTAVAVAKCLGIYNGGVMEGDEISVALDEWEGSIGRDIGRDVEGGSIGRDVSAGRDGSVVRDTKDRNINKEINNKDKEINHSINNNINRRDINRDKEINPNTNNNDTSNENTVIERFSDMESTDRIGGARGGRALMDVSVFARADPKHKERLIRFYKAKGLVTLMCGDGTNDVGALNEADVGVALLVNEQKKAQPESLREALLSELMDKKVNLGDACVAAPFTIRNGLLSGVLSVVRQGRSTLVTTFQMYKILALNSLITAYSLSFLDSIGIRFNDYQITISGILLAFAFMFLTRCEPLEHISAQRPLTGIFNTYFMTSIMSQTAIHIISTFILVMYIGTPSHYNEKFVPTTLNSSLFILSTSQQVSTFIVNYIGRPFRESFMENAHLRNSLFVCLGFCVFVLFEVNLEMNRALEIVELGDVRMVVMGLMVADWACCYLVERCCARLWGSRTVR
ncbi:P-type ATPase (P-ATPase) Superfamily, partial [Trachipleistophora hominis]